MHTYTYITKQIEVFYLTAFTQGFAYYVYTFCHNHFNKNIRLCFIHIFMRMRNIFIFQDFILMK